MKEITGHTKLTGLLGSPVSHSISPSMHNEAFQLLNLDYVYLAFNVQSGTLYDALKGLKAIGIRGFNLTMPLKTEIIRYVDHLSPAAALCGSVNTVINNKGVLTGDTTDGIGYMRSLTEVAGSPKDQVMTLLGAGGAAVSILVQAALDGMKEIRVFNRKGANFDKAAALIEKVHMSTQCKITLDDIEDHDLLAQSILSSNILTNSTSVGMAPNDNETLIKDRTLFHENLIVSDVIYNPRETKLLSMAKEQGCKTLNGLNMLLYQGAESFRLWTGHEMPIEPIREKYFT